MPSIFRFRRRGKRIDALRNFSRRGMALLLVMIGMVVCTILTAGYLSTQGTSIGIARNERDATKCHAIAQTGVDMCFWLMRNKPDWRATMTPGQWLNNAVIGDGTVSVNVADGDGTNNFSDDTTQSVVISSTGTFDNRSFTLTATIRPTGGGAVFAGGNFISGKVYVGNLDLLTASTVDSYNSTVAAYNSSSPGSNAAFSSVSTASDSLLVYFPSVFRGSYASGPGTLLSSVLSLIGLGVSGPSSTSNLAENRNAGYVVMPNISGITYRGTAYNTSTVTAKDVTAAGSYDDLGSASSCTTNIKASGLYYIKNNLTLGTNAGSVLNVTDGTVAVVYVNGNVAINTGKIVLQGSAQLALYVNGSITLTNGSINNGGNTTHLAIFGGPAGGTISLTNTGAAIYGSIYAPQHTMTMQTSAPKFFGGVVASSLTLKNNAAFHFDEALRAMKISNINGGSAPPGGVADYTVTITGGPGIQR
ncbi:MAG TPA: hypothetical protein VGN88_07100 [Phycisphaerae bacterium]